MKNKQLQFPRGTIIAPRAQKNSRSAEILSQFPLAVFSFFLLGVIVTILGSVSEQRHFAAYKHSVREVVVSVKLAPPTLVQDSIATAVALYSIDMPDYVSWPVYDSALADRGLTTGGTLDTKKSVQVGAAAFASWGVLGSTLGHEIEVHCGQSFLNILFFDRIGRLSASAKNFWGAERAIAAGAADVEEGWGTWRAERTAYGYEISSAARFGLSRDEIASIIQVRDFYYPENPR